MSVAGCRNELRSIDHGHDLSDLPHSVFQNPQTKQDFPHFSGDMFYKLSNLWHFSESSSGSLLSLRS